MSVSQVRARHQATTQGSTQNTLPPHACHDCDARFKRLEHLKRHIASIHQKDRPKPYKCQFCGKGFSRSDVLPRHHQTCRVNRSATDATVPGDPRGTRACQSCLDRNITCSGGTPCEKCAELEQECIHVNSRKLKPQEHTIGLLSPVTDPSQTDSEGNTRACLGEANFGTISRSAGSGRLQNGRGSTTERQSQSAFSATPSWQNPDFALEMGQLNNSFSFGHEPSSGAENGHGWRQWDVTDRADHQATVLPQKRPFEDADADDDSTIVLSMNTDPITGKPLPEERRMTHKRGRYVSSACIHCQKRKVKCSGEQNCAQCRSGGLVCAYNSSRKRRGTVDPREQQSKSDTASVQNLRPPAWQSDESVTNSLTQMMARIASLERNCSLLKDQIVISDDDASTSSGAASIHDNDSSSPSESNSATLPIKEAFQGQTSLLEPIGFLDRTIATQAGMQPESGPESRAMSPVPTTWCDLPRGGDKAVETLERETRLNDVPSLRKAVDVFFSYLNPHYPCLNENQFRGQLDSFLGNDDRHQLARADRHQLVALVNLIQAEVKILGEDWSDSTRAPAWEEFCRAESILNRLTWLGNGNIMTIQCLLIKARYLLYAEKANGAYDTMGRVVRLAWQLGLHDQPSWAGCSPFEVVMRQRIFWTIFYVERNIAFNAGAPYLIRESDINVDFPPNLDDKLMFVNQPLPEEETPERSSAPYLCGAAKWGKLCAEIWDSAFGVNAQKPTSQEFIATMDARIKYTLGQLPAQLRWERNIHRLDGTTDVPAYVLRQTAILYLRMNQLRLLLRQGAMLGLSYDDEIARDCVSIATSSINSIYASYHAPSHRPTDRFSSVLYLVGSLLPLVCVIVRGENIRQTQTDAIEAFNKDLSLLQDMAPNFSAARHTLQRLSRVIKTTERAIRRFHNEEQFVFDPKEFETETLVPQITEFFHNDNHLDLDMNAINEFSGPFMYGANNQLDGDLSGMISSTSSLWADYEFLNKSYTM